MEQLFFVFSLLLSVSVMMTITSSNPMHSVFWLVLVFIFSSGFLLTMNFEFLALMMIMMYVGAIAMLFLFVMMMLDIVQLKKSTPVNNMIPILFMVSVNMLLELWWLYKYNYSFEKPKFLFKELSSEINNHIVLLGLNLYTEFGYPLLIMSILLLIAMMGAMILTLELSTMTSKQLLTNQHHSNNSWT